MHAASLLSMTATIIHPYMATIIHAYMATIIHAYMAYMATIIHAYMAATIIHAYMAATIIHAYMAYMAYMTTIIHAYMAYMEGAAASAMFRHYRLHSCKTCITAYCTLALRVSNNEQEKSLQYMQKWLLHQAATSTTYITVAASEHKKLVCMFGPWLFGQLIPYWHEIIPRNYIY